MMMRMDLYSDTQPEAPSLTAIPASLCEFAFAWREAERALSFTRRATSIYGYRRLRCRHRVNFPRTGRHHAAAEAVRAKDAFAEDSGFVHSNLAEGEVSDPGEPAPLLQTV